MRNISKILGYAVLLGIFVIGMSILMKQFELYQRAYQELGKNISHPSINKEVIFEEVK